MKHLSRLRMALVLALSVTTVQASDALMENLLHYQIGGGRPLKPTHSGLLNLSWKMDTGLNRNGNGCSTKFDPSGLLKAQFDGVADGLMQQMNGMVSAVTGMVAGLPFMILQRTQPELYDFMLQGNLSFLEDLKKYTASCEDMMAVVDKALPADKLTKSSAVESLRTKMNSATKDIKTTMKQVVQDTGKDGVTAAGGDKKGGAGQPPLTIVEEVSRSGYNAQFNRSATATGSPGSSAKDQALYKAWPTPKQASNWLVDAVGETTLQTCDQSDGCEKTQTKPGKGLQSLYNTDYEATKTQLDGLINNNRQLTQTELDSISSSNVRMSQSLVDAIRAVGDSSTIERMSSEIALANTLERSMLARRLLVAGRKEANLTNNEVLQTEVDRKLKELDDEIDNMLREMDIRTKLNASTPQKLLEAYVVARQTGTVRSSDGQATPLRSDGALSK